MKIKEKICLLVLISILTVTTTIMAFGPSNSTIYEGIDVSEWQREINYTAVKNSGIQIVYIKSSEGTTYIDPYFETNYKKAKENNLKVGVYHYVRAINIEEAEEEAKFFASVISGKDIDCKLAMDFEAFENLSIEQINQISLVFLRKTEQLTGKEMIVYSNTNDARNIFNQEIANNYPIWVAEYGPSEPENNGKWNKWEGFQYTDMGNIPGISGNVDQDKYTSNIFLTDTSTIPNNDNPNTNETNITYIIKRGDTLSAIALKYKTTVQKLANINNIQNPNLIYAGNILIIPTTNTTNNVGGHTGKKIYTIQYGDTLTSISRKFGVSIEYIAKLNNIQNPNLIYAGDRIRI